MDNQHKLIKGYRDLSQEEINLMNSIKSLGTQVEKLIEEIKFYNPDVGSVRYEEQKAVDQANQFISSAEMDLRVGFMKLVRAVAKPTTF